MKLYPRHYKLIEFLTSVAPKRFTVDALAKATGISKNTLGNELPNLYMDGHIYRDNHGRTFLYYMPKDKSKSAPRPKPAQPLNNTDVLAVLPYISNQAYEPKLVKLAWTYPQAILELTHCAQAQEPPTVVKQALLEVLESVEGLSLAMRRLLSTPQLWDDRLSQWLTEGLTEEDLEKLAELTRQGTAAHGRLTAQEQDTINPKDEPND